MIKKYYVVFSFIVMSCLFIACSKANQLPLVSPEKYSSQHDYHEALLSNFVKDKLLGEYGVYTNYLDTEQEAEVATGHEVLSESSGLLLKYFALRGDHKHFEQLWKETVKTFNMDSGFSYRYSPIHEKKYSHNAAVDDLRLINALFEASSSFNANSYKDEALKYGERFIQYNTNHEKMFDLYDETYKLNNQFITLSHIDLITLTRLASEFELDDLIANQLHIVKSGYLSDEFPFYETRYIYETDSYQSEHINTIESLITILHLVEVGEHHPLSITFLKDKVINEQLVSQYAIDGTALNDVQSTSLYAVSAMIASQVDDVTFYEKSIALMEKYLILDNKSELFGSFANAETMQLYAHDNLNALLAYYY